MDWLDLFRRIANNDPAVREAARESLFRLDNAFWDADADVLKSDVQAMLPAFEEKDGQVRLQVSALLSALSLGRPDGTITLESAVPALLAHFNDADTTIHRNAVFAIINLKPEIPDQALEPLIPMIQDSDRETADAATHGLTRLALKSSVARTALKSAMTGKDVPLHVKQAVVETIRVAKSDNPEIIGLLSIALSDDNRSLVLSGLRAASKLGALAASLGPQLQKLAETHPDLEVRANAVAAIDSLRGETR
jgi:hypothetical protein